MSMIKRGHSDSSRPSVISSVRRCAQCGHCDNFSFTCPKCQGRMTESIIDSGVNDKDCDEDCERSNGTCKLDN